MTMADIAAALGNLSRHAEAKAVAEGALPLVQGVRELAKTEAALHGTLGIGHYQEGDSDSEEGARHFAIARLIFRSLPGGSQMLETLDSNAAHIRAP